MIATFGTTITGQETQFSLPSCAMFSDDPGGAVISQRARKKFSPELKRNAAASTHDAQRNKASKAGSALREMRARPMCSVSSTWSL